MPIGTVRFDTIYCQMCKVNPVIITNPKVPPKFCPKCLKEFRSKMYGKIKERSEIDKKTKEVKQKNFLEGNFQVTAPDGSILNLATQEIKDFYEGRIKEYKQDFDWKGSSDSGLLTQLLSIELQNYIITQKLNLSHCNANNDIDVESLNLLTVLSKEMRLLQDNLGITRNQRLQAKENKTPYELLNEWVMKYQEFKNLPKPDFRNGAVFNDVEKIWEYPLEKKAGSQDESVPSSGKIN